ncbi:MAG: AsmA family protein [Acidobacteriaceae bacterium]
MENPPTPKGKMGRARVPVLIALALLVLAIVAPPFVNINRFRRGIVQSISEGLGRPVYANSVDLALFPRPAFILHHFTVAAGPGFGAEPVIMAETVTASLRASTLWHRRVEIARLDFDAPSVNLARNDQGQWNFASLMRNSPVLRLHGAASSTSPPPFPYVEATNARINFKLGPEKLPFSLEGADLAFWKQSGNEWHVRVKAQPVRTDLVAADTGQIIGEASIATAAVLMNAPIHASLEWRRVELGEISRLFLGGDRGWRGNVDWTAGLRGTLAKLSVTSDIQVEEFRRAEFVPPSEMDLATHCQAQFVDGNRLPDSLQCDAPLGGGHLLLQGHFRNPLPSSDFSHSVGSVRLPLPGPPGPASVQIALQHISAGFFLELLRHVHPGVSTDATVSGEVNGNVDCDWRGLDTLDACSGEAHSTPLTLALPHLQYPLHLSPLVLASSPAAGANAASISTRKAPASRMKRKPVEAPPVSPTVTWSLAPTHVSLGGPTPVTMVGTVTSSGPTLNIVGAADLAKLNRLAYALNIPAISSGIHSIRGSAQLALTLESTWLPVLADADAIGRSGAGVQTGPLAGLTSFHWFVPSQWSGRLQIHNATLQLVSFPGTIQIAAAQVNLTPARVEWTGLTGSYAHIPLDGSVGWQTSCPALGTLCERTFTLHTSNLNVDHLQAALRQSFGDTSLLERINPWAGGVPEMPEISGTFNADLLSAGKLSLKNASLQLRLQGHHAELLAFSGALFGGTLSGIPAAASGMTATPAGPELSSGRPVQAIESAVGSAEWGDGSPVYTLRAGLRNIQPDLVAAIWRQRWGPGAANAEFRLSTRGWSAAELAQNMLGNFSIDWENGTFSSPSPDSTAISPSSDATDGIRFQRLDAKGTIRNQTLALDSGHMVFANPHPGHRASGSATQSLSGTVTFSRMLDLRLQPSGISITGPLDMPVVSGKSMKSPVRAVHGYARF